MPWGAVGTADMPHAYNKKEWNNTYDLQEYDSKARQYYPALMRTTTQDPLAEQYYDTSPYAWCANNPVRMVDEDGKRSTLTYTKNSITIYAKYYTKDEDYYYAQMAVDFWNKQKDLTYTDENGNTYNIVFNLELVTAADPVDIAKTETNANAFLVVDKFTQETTSKGYKINGRTQYNYKIEVLRSKASTLTGAHEIGHTLMTLDVKNNGHASTGVMTQFSNSPSRTPTVSQETINEIIESHKPSFLKKIWITITNLFR